MEILTIHNLNYSYDGTKQVLKNINLSFKLGKLYSIFGKSGAGKSTLLSLLGGLERYQEGSILYYGEELASKNYDRYRGTEVGIVFQNYNLLPHLTALENVILSMEISHQFGKEKEKKAFDLLKKVGLNEEKANRRVLKLSGGEQQRVAIARALSYHAPLILADEPTGNLDKETEEEILNLLVDLAHQEQKCVIVISHSSKVKEIADVVYELKNGEVEV